MGLRTDEGVEMAQLAPLGLGPGHPAIRTLAEAASCAWTAAG